MELALKVGDRVRLTRAGVICYGGQWPHFVPQGQGGGGLGTVRFAGERPHKPGAAPRPYYVTWDNGVENSYRVEDLEPAGEEDLVHARETGEEEAPTNIVPFSRWG